MRGYLQAITQTHQKQQTLKRAVSLSGIGVHSGELCVVTISPAPDNYGFCFSRERVLIPALSKYVTNTQGAMTLMRSGVSVQPVEHLLAALVGMGFHNARIDLTGPEIPIFDGSALPWIKILRRAGFQSGLLFPRIFTLQVPIIFQHQNSLAYLQPANEMSIACHVQGQFARAKTIEEVAAARTYVQSRALEPMRQKGLLKGAQWDSGILLDGSRPLNTEFRMRSELAKHKILDAMGDFALLGGAILARIELWNNNHDFHRRLIEKLHPSSC